MATPPAVVASGYRDFGSATEADFASRKRESAGEQPNNRFPVQLHYALSEMEKDGQSEVAAWLPHGRAFIIRDKARFEKEVLPFWFRQSKFPSFQRQLNTYGFHRISADKGAYYHELFLRGKGFLASFIPRRRVKPAGEEKQMSPILHSVDFYALPAIQEEMGSNQATTCSSHEKSSPRSIAPQNTFELSSLVVPQQNSFQDTLSLRKMLLPQPLNTNTAASPPPFIGDNPILPPSSTASIPSLSAPALAPNLSSFGAPPLLGPSNNNLLETLWRHRRLQALRQHSLQPPEDLGAASAGSPPQPPSSQSDNDR